MLIALSGQRATSWEDTSFECQLLLQAFPPLLADTQTYTGFLLPNGTINGSQPVFNYTSPLFHHVTVGGLQPQTLVRLYQ